MWFCCNKKDTSNRDERKFSMLWPIEKLYDQHDELGDSSLLHYSLSSADRENQIRLHAQQQNKIKAKRLRKPVHHDDGRRTIFARPIDVTDPDFVPPHHPKTKEEFIFLDEALGETFFFNDLTAPERKLLIEAMQREKVNPNTRIIQQGDVGDFFYVVQEGTVQFLVKDEPPTTTFDDLEDMELSLRDEKKLSICPEEEAKEVPVGTCNPGGSFGELALLYDALRAATCVATTPCTLWKVDRKTFQFLLARHSHDHEKDICELIHKVPLLEGLDSANKSKFSAALTTVKYRQGDRIVNKGDVGEVFYIIHEGQVRVHDIGTGAQFVDQILGPGEWFGERALMTGEPRVANITALSETVTTFAMDRETFEKAIGPLQNVMDHEMKKRCLQGLPVIANSNFLPVELDQLVDLLQEICFIKGTKLAEVGKPYKQHLWIIRHGRIRVFNKLGDIFNLQSGDYFGDDSIRGSPTQKSSHTAVCEDNTTCWVITREEMESVIGDIQRLGEFLPYVSSKFNSSIRLRDVRKHKLLGMGAFGKVWLASHREAKTVYALKQLDKRQLIDSKKVAGVIREKDIMSSMEHPFILCLVSSFQDESSLYLLTEYIQGGELFSVIHSGKNIGLREKDAKFYCACVLEGLGHMHQRSICYRDLKPENLLVDSMGYCVIVDLGFCKIVVDKTYTLCGTPEYLAPEIIMSKGHDRAVDYWSFGVLIYEALVGQSPFFIPGTDQVSLFRRIVMVKYGFPSDHELSEDAMDIIQKLLVRRQATRLGNLARGHLDVRDHPWFEKSIVFKKLLKKEIKAPWVPRISDALDSSHFDDYSSRERPQRPSKPLSREEQELFKNF